MPIQSCIDAVYLCFFSQKVTLIVTVVDYDRIGTSEPIGRVVLGCNAAGNTYLPLPKSTAIVMITVHLLFCLGTQKYCE